MLICHHVADPLCRKPKRIGYVGNMRLEPLKLAGQFADDHAPIVVGHQRASPGNLVVVGFKMLKAGLDQR